MALHLPKLSTFLPHNQYTFLHLSQSSTLLDQLLSLRTGEEVEAIKLQLVATEEVLAAVVMAVVPMEEDLEAHPFTFMFILLPFLAVATAALPAEDTQAEATAALPAEDTQAEATAALPVEDILAEATAALPAEDIPAEATADRH